MMLIDADALERDGWYLCRTVQVDKNTMEYQTKKPTAFKVLEVVMCKDCKYSSDNGVYGCTIESFNYDFNTRMYANDFCGKAERRTDG